MAASCAAWAATWASSVWGWPDRGKGSHGIAYLNGQRTVVRNLKDELKTGTFHGMLKQLGIDESDLYD